MIIKIEILLNTNEEYINNIYQGDKRGVCQIILDELKSTIEYEEFGKIIIAEAVDTKEIK